MIDYAERVDEVCLLLEREWGVSDRQAVEILLASRLEMPQVPYPWIILETQCYAFDMSEAWFNFGADSAVSLPQYRVNRPRAGNAELTRVLADRDRPALFIEPNFERIAVANCKLVMYPYLLQTCLRLRSDYPKAAPIEKGRVLVLRASAAAALDNRWRVGQTMKLAMPPWLLYYAELLQRLAEGLRDWETLIRNLCHIAQRRAWLFNRDVDSTDWQAVLRVMRDTVPQMTTRILQQIEKTGRWHALRCYYPDQVIHREVKRLMGEGVVWSHQGRWLLSQTETIGKDTISLLNGQVEV